MTAPTSDYSFPRLTEKDKEALRLLRDTEYQERKLKFETDYEYATYNDLGIPDVLARINIEPKDYLEALHKTLCSPPADGKSTSPIIDDSLFHENIDIMLDMFKQSVGSTKKDAQGVMRPGFGNPKKLGKNSAGESNSNYGLAFYVNRDGILVVSNDFKGNIRRVTVDLKEHFYEQYSKTWRAYKESQGAQGGSLDFTDVAMYYANMDHLKLIQDPNFKANYDAHMAELAVKQQTKLAQARVYVDRTEFVSLLSARNEALSREILKVEYNQLLSTNQIEKSNYIRGKHPENELHEYLPYYKGVAIASAGYSPVLISDNSIEASIQHAVEPIQEGMEESQRKLATFNNAKRFESEKLKRLVQRLHAIDPDNPLLKNDHPLNMEVSRVNQAMNPSAKSSSVEEYINSPSFVPLQDRSVLPNSSPEKNPQRLIVPAFHFVDTYDPVLRDDVKKMVFWGGQDFNKDNAGSNSEFSDKMSRKDAGSDGGFFPAVIPDNIAKGESFHADQINRIYILEGISTTVTCATMMDALNLSEEKKNGLMVLGCFSVNNATNRALDLSKQFPDAEIYVIHDDDFKPQMLPHGKGFKLDAKGNMMPSEEVDNAGLRSLLNIVKDTEERSKRIGVGLAASYALNAEDINQLDTRNRLKQEISKGLITSIITPIPRSENQWEFKTRGSSTSVGYGKGKYSDVNDFVNIAHFKYNMTVAQIRESFERMILQPLHNRREKTLNTMAGVAMDSIKETTDTMLAAIEKHHGTMNDEKQSMFHFERSEEPEFIEVHNKNNQASNKVARLSP